MIASPTVHPLRTPSLLTLGLSLLVLAEGCGSASNNGSVSDAGGVDVTISDAEGHDSKVGSDAGPSPDGETSHTAQFPVKNVIFFVKENRTFDNYFGKFPGANGATSGFVCDGGAVPLAPLLDRSSPDITHAWAAALTSYNDGGMNCFDRITTARHPNGTPLSDQVADEGDIPNYFLLAQTFVPSDNF